MKKVLFIGAHPDDIEIGCGGTIHKHRNDWEIMCGTLSSTGLNGINPGLATCQYDAMSALGVHSIVNDVLNPSHMKEDRQKIWEFLDRFKTFDPDVVFTHDPDDHQDHVAVFEETMRCFYGKSIITYHITRSQSNFYKNCWEPLEGEDVAAKIKALSCYSMYQFEGTYEPSIKSCFDPDAIRALLRGQGVYIGKQYAETFKIQTCVGL